MTAVDVAWQGLDDETRLDVASIDFAEEGGQCIGKGRDAEGKREVDDGHIVGNGQAAIGDNESIGMAKARDGTGERGIEEAGLTHR